jgi:polysaccharide pyruvyl transferase WcaK-like protein
MDNRSDANWGSRATTNALFQLLREAHPQAEIRGVPRSAGRPKSALMRRVCEAIAPRAAVANDWERGLRPIVLRMLTEKMRPNLEWADLIVVNGEGTLHPQKQTLRWMPVISALPRFTGAPIWIVNCSIEVCSSKWEGLWKVALAKAERIVVREVASFTEVQRLGLEVEQGADCAFTMKPVTCDRVNEILAAKGVNRPFAVFTGSALAATWPVRPQKTVISMLGDLGYNVVYASSTHEDMENYARLKMKCPLITQTDADYQEIMGIIKEASLLIGGRFHPIVFTACAGTPFVCLGSNTHKMEGLMKLLGTEERIADVADTPKIRKLIGAVLEGGDDERHSLKARSRELADLARLNAAPAKVQ